MKKVKKIIWGIVWIIVGVIVMLKAFDVIDFKLFFDGWWTLFIIVPGVIGIFTEKDKTGCLIAVCIGVVLLLCCLDVFGFDMLWKLALPLIIVLVGLKMIIGAFTDREGVKIWKEIEEKGKTIKTVTAVFVGSDMDLSGEKVEGIKCTAVFGGIKCDLTAAILEEDCAIDIQTVFGGVDIILPANVNVKIHSNSLFGGVENENHKNSTANTITVHINATCVFGGVEIK